jgi:hypothetical protein
MDVREPIVHELRDTIALLERTPRSLSALLRDVPDSWVMRDEGADTWSVYDVIGHLVHGELTDWIPRTRLILQTGTTVAFAPFDRYAQKKESEGLSLGQLLDRFAELRTRNLVELAGMHLSPSDLAREGMHPALGTVTLSQLLATWAAHDLTHLHQISRVMAFQIRDLVGPWQQYLGVLHCQGHGI